MPSPRLDFCRAASCRFAEELRAEGVAIGTAELLDAFAALGEVPWTAARGLPEALAATLAKSQEDRRVFELVFERFFFRAAEAEAIERGRARGGRDRRRRRAARSTSTRCARQIAAALREGNEGAMRDLARLAIAAFGRQGEGSGVIGVDVQRIRRALGLRAEPQPDLPPDDPRAEGAAARRDPRVRGAPATRARAGQIERTESCRPRAR